MQTATHDLHHGLPAIAWAVSPQPVAYETAVAAMEGRVRLIKEGLLPELVWLLEHPPLYTAGVATRPEDLASAAPELPIHRSGRGGQLTYHGPGQRICYVMLDVRRRFGGDVGCFTSALEEWLIRSLAGLGIVGERVPGRTGVWVPRAGPPAKIASIGLRIRHGISFHGVSLNVNPDLRHFGGIVPCGVRDAGVTSLADLSVAAPIDVVDIVLIEQLEALFGRLTAGRDPIGNG